MINKNFINTFGPGILFAGAAIGTSHLVQSTRAGAVYGLGMILLVIFANAIKYPFYRFGPLYTASTGHSILHGYRQLGKWAIVTVIFTELPVNIIIVAASALVTAGIMLSVFDLNLGVIQLAIAIIVCAFALIGFGGYKFIDRFTKVFVAILTVCTLATTFLTLPSVDWGIENFVFPAFDTKTVAFVLALLGFMPAGASLSILHSVWSAEKMKVTGYRPSIREAMTDLNIGYIGSAVLAVCFLIMGAGVLHENDIELSSNSGQFAGQVIAMYTTTLGSWAGFVVGTSVFAVMISTLLTVLDGFARMHVNAAKQLTTSSTEHDSNHKADKRLHILMMAVIGFFASLVLMMFMKNFKTFIDLVIITAFLIGPVIAILNHVVMHGSTVPKALKPSPLITLWSYACIVFLVSLSAVYLLS